MIKNVNIKAYQIGLVFKNRNLIEVLKEGNHYLFGNKSVEIHEMKSRFEATEDLPILLKNETLKNLLEIVEVKDGEIILLYENEIFKDVLSVGKYAFWKGIVNREFKIIDLTKVEISEEIPKTILENMKVKSFVRKFIVPQHYKGLLLIDGKLTQVLESGTYSFWNNETSVEVKIIDPNCEIKSQFGTYENVAVLLKNEILKNLLKIVEVKDGEIILVYENGALKEVLNVGQYAFWKGIIETEFQKVDLAKVEITEGISNAILENARLRNYVRKFVVTNQYKGLLLIDGKLTEILEAGTYYFWNNEISIEVKSVDMRMQQMEIAGQELLTKDKAMLRINFYVRFQVENIEKALMENKEYDKQLYILMQLALREFVGALTLDELLLKKDAVGKEILRNLGDKAEDLGLKASDAGIRDVILTGEMKEIMNQVLIAEKKAQANSIMRREETASTRSLLNTAKLMEENETLWKLKEMEYMEKIADKIGDITVSGNSNIVSQLKEIFAK
ncbi:slipin family protein [Chryseobacterium sp. Ch-15]|uniref:Slipin family protein n=2 Tax=Chryseobacterium muglaense TaxID=2893752 RepID=A0A9Q3UW58_9FLAO|nr:slipin family protein [Chryseobacterium muglaense]MCC9034439.1 slipin family protein [Chryseobacterium muglaense]MCM2554546.1 slipin family protein [Chryseobacterium muglaense]